MKPLDEVAEHYFNSLNPIAERINAEVVAIKDAYEDLWNCLSSKEKNQIINETVVHPEAVLKYALTKKSCEEVNVDVPLLTRQVTGAKYIVDESTGLSWRDEHSGPFSWKTPSQIDLTLFTSSKGETNTKELNKFLEFNKSIGSSNNKKNKNNENNYFGLSQIDNTFPSVFNKEDFHNKKFSKRKDPTPIPENNVVLIGTCSRLTGLCSKLKFLPGKSYSYEVQTVISNPSKDVSFLDKLKTTAVFKLQNTFKIGGGKNIDKKTEEHKETETLVQSKGTVTVMRLSKPCPKIAKPKSPPPPPPAVISNPNNEETDEKKAGKNLIFARNSKDDTYQDEKDSEKTTLLGESSVHSFLSGDLYSLEQDLQSKLTNELSDDFNSINTECTPLGGPSIDAIPKSGFDFLDNW